MIDSTWVQVGTLAVVTISAVGSGAIAVIKTIGSKFAGLEEKIDNIKDVGDTRHAANGERFARLEAKLEVIRRNGHGH